MNPEDLRDVGTLIQEEMISVIETWRQRKLEQFQVWAKYLQDLQALNEDLVIALDTLEDE